jgi:glycosidase
VRHFVSAVAVAIALGTAAAAYGLGAAPPRPPSGAELAALAQPPVAPALASQRIYFVMTDRYANGDPANDRGGKTGGRSDTGYDPTDTGWFHGGDFKGLTGDCTGPRGLARISELGFTTIWVTPSVGQKTVQGDSAAYHGYWGIDFSNVDPHLGTNADFAAFVACAHSLGMKVILDVVVNHTGDVIRLSSSQYVGPPQAPHAASVLPEERSAKSPAWLNDTANYHNRGDIDFNSCNEQCFELGDFFGLDDIATEKAAVRDGLADLWADWIRRYKLDGFRVDTARHVNRSFFGAWVPKILAAARDAGVPDFQLFGEVALNDTIELSRFVRDRGLPNVLDFPFQDAATRFAGGSAGAQGIADRLSDDDYFRTTAGIAPAPPTFLGNHDQGRAALKIREGSIGEGGTLLQRVLLGYDLLYLLRGAPVVYYGDEVGMIGRGGDKAARQDMFPTQVDEWRTEERVGSAPVGAGSSFDVDSPIAAHLRTLAGLRDRHPVFSLGASIVRRSDRRVLVVSRIDATERREYVAAFNSGTSAANAAVRTATPSTRWAGLLNTVTADSAPDGTLSFEVPPLSSVLYRSATPIPAAAPVRPALRVARDNLSDLWRLTATAGAAPVTVSFAVKRGNARWQRLSVDDSPPYRAFLDPTRFRNRERVHLVAIVRSLDGTTATSRVVPFTVRR